MIAANAVDTIGASLKSASFADDIVVVVPNLKDSTASAARRLGARVFAHPLKGFGPTKNFAIGKSRGEWLLSLDADEVVTPALRRQIEAVVRADGPHSLYGVPRRNFYFGRWLRHGGKYPDRQYRLFRRGSARFLPKHLHEGMVTAGSRGNLSAPLDHYPYRSLEEFFRKLVFYAAYDAEHLHAKGISAGFSTAFRYCAWRPTTRFIRRYFLKLGFLDGVPGLLACLHDSLTNILTYSFLSGLRSR
jgi:glycosyltransferase involved in cell wall biosynthesis